MNSSGASRRTLTNSMHHVPAGSVAKQRTNPNRWIELTVGVRRLKDLPDLSALDSKRPAERRYMTRDQLKNDYGSDPAAVEAIEKFAADHYLVVTKDERASARLGLGGTVANFSAAFASPYSTTLIRASGISTRSPGRSRSPPHSAMQSPACSASTTIVRCAACPANRD